MRVSNFQQRVLNLLFDDRYGGAQKRVIEVGSGLRGIGIETVVGLPTGTGNAEEIARQNGLRVQRVEFARIPRPSRPLQVASWLVSLAGDVRRFSDLIRTVNPDVIHVNSPLFLPAAIAARFSGRPFVWHLNDTIIPRPVSRAVGATVRRMATEVAVSSWSVAEHYGVPPDAAVVIYPPVRLDRFSSTRKGPPDRDTVRVGFLANWSPVKGVEYFVEAMHIVHESLGERLRVVMAGARWPNQATYWEPVIDHIDALGMGSVVEDHGFVPSVEELLADIDIVVSCSTSEACPMVMLESLAAAVPVVASDVGGVREILLRDPTDPAGVVVPTRDAGAIAAAVLKLLHDPATRRRLGRRGRRLAEEVFGVEACIERHQIVYERMVAGRGSLS